MAASPVIAWLIGCVSILLLLTAVLDAAWWHYTRDQHAAVTAIGYFAGAAATVALIPVVFWLKYELSGWSELKPQQPGLRGVAGVHRDEDARFDSVPSAEARFYRSETDA
jgi:hypothetical protein